MTEPASPARNSADWAVLLARCSPSGQQPAEFRDRICSIDSDLTDTEKEGEMLNRKLNKRLSGNSTDLNSEFFLDKLTKWQSNKKIEKLKTLLCEHLPKVKHLEKEIQSSAKTVATDKVVASSQATCLMSLIDQQIEYYQQHLNFLDDVINDIRQCDFTVVREIADIKMAFTFSMELDARQRANARNSTPSNPLSVLLKVGVDSNGHAPSKRILDDNRLIPTIPATTRQKPPLLIIPSANHVTSEDTSGIHVHSTASASADESEAVQVISATSGGRISPSMAKSAASLPSSIFKEALLNSISLNATSTSEYPSEFPLDEAVVKGTGADYKRKCLMSSSINIQSLHLTKRDSSGAEEYTGFGNSTPPDGKKKSGKSDKGSDKGSDKEKVVLPSPRKFMRAVSSKLSEISTQLSGKEGGKHDKGEKEEMARLGMGMKQRCLSVPNGLCNEGVAAESTTFSHAKQERPSSAGTTQGSTTETKEEKKTRHRRTMSAGGSFFFPSSNRVGGTSTSPTAAIASSSSRCTTPRSADNHSIPLSPPSVLTHKDKNNCVLARPSTPSGGLSSELQHLGIAEMHIDTATPAAAGGTGEGKEEEEETEDSPMFPDLVLGASQIILDGRQSTTSSSSFDAPVAGALSTSSSCSNFSQASTVVTSPTDPASAPSTARSTGDGVGNKRKKYAALLFHYPNLQPCLQDPALKVVAKRLNKCLKFKDELQRSLVKAETVQETETTCLRKLRKVQHNLEDLAHHCAHPPQDAPLQPSLTSSDSNGTARSSTERRSSELSHHGYRSACSSGSSYSYNCASTVEGLQSTSGSSHDVLKLSAGDFDAADLRRVSSSGEKSCFLHHDHDMSSTDDEHEHSNASNASCSSQSLQEQHGFSLHSTLFEPHHPRNGGTSPQRAASYHPAGSSGISNGPGMLATPCTYSTEEDPTIIDQSHDAAVSQMSAEILECAARCAQHLKVLLAEEQEVTDKLARVRHLLSSAQHIDEQLVAKFSK